MGLFLRFFGRGFPERFDAGRPDERLDPDDEPVLGPDDRLPFGLPRDSPLGLAPLGLAPSCWFEDPDDAVRLALDEPDDDSLDDDEPDDPEAERRSPADEAVPDPDAADEALGLARRLRLWPPRRGPPESEAPDLRDPEPEPGRTGSR